ncbi:MAG: hypothetical protein IJ859_09420 [Synergistaceae bacterium]|nr:hypothetical protein [Synergistaceae bacterium]
MPNNKKDVTNYENFRKIKVSFDQASDFLNMSKSSFYRLIESGVIPKSDDGKYTLSEVVEAYWRNQFDSEGLKAAQTRLVTAQAELKEAELAEQRGELHRASAIAKVWTDNVINTRTKLLAIPNKIAPELIGQDLQTVQQKLKNAIYEVLRELADYDGEKITRTAAIQGN